MAVALRHLGVERAHRMLGASYGGMVALAMGIRHPARVDGVVLIGAAHRSHPQAIGIHAVQRWIVEFALRHGRGSEGVALARALAFTTYKSAEGLDARFPHDWEWEDGAPVYAVGRYLEKQGREFADRFEAETYLTLSASVRPVRPASGGTRRPRLAHRVGGGHPGPALAATGDRKPDRRAFAPADSELRRRTRRLPAPRA